ncbi:MAG: GumC family protein [Balneolaceae bacterium]
MSNGDRPSVNILDLLLLIARYRKRIFLIVFGITLVALGASLVWPKTYKSTVRFAQYDSGGGGMAGSLISSLVQMPFSSGRVSAEQSTIILRSRTMQDAVIDRFDLAEVYGISVREYVREELANNTIIEEAREGGIGFSPIVSVSLSVTDRSPERAKEIAEFYMSQLDSMMTGINRKNAEMTLRTYERRYLQNVQELEEAEQALTAFQEEAGILEPESQLRAMMSTIGELRAQMVGLDVQINIAKATLRDSAPQVMELEKQRAEVEKVYNDLIRDSEREFSGSAGTGSGAGSGTVSSVGSDAGPGTGSRTGMSGDLFPPMMEMPKMGLEYARLFRERTIQEKIYELIYPQYEQQKMLLDDTNSGIRLIDEANLPTYKHKPKRALIVIAGFLFSIFVAFFSITFSEFVKRGQASGDENYQKYLKLKEQFGDKS